MQGCFKLIKTIFKDNLWKYFFGLILILLVLHSYLYTLLPTLVGNRVISRFENYPIEGKNVGLWIKNNIPENASLMGSRIDLNIYGNRKFYKTPQGNLTSVKEFAQKNNIQYISYDNRYAFYLNPQLRVLLTDGEKDEVELIYAYKDLNQIYGQVNIWKFKDIYD